MNDDPTKDIDAALQALRPPTPEELARVREASLHLDVHYTVDNGSPLCNFDRVAGLQVFVTRSFKDASCERCKTRWCRKVLNISRMIDIYVRYGGHESDLMDRGALYAALRNGFLQ